MHKKNPGHNYQLCMYAYEYCAKCVIYGAKTFNVVLKCNSVLVSVRSTQTLISPSASLIRSICFGHVVQCAKYHKPPRWGCSKDWLRCHCSPAWPPARRASGCALGRSEPPGRSSSPSPSADRTGVWCSRGSPGIWTQSSRQDSVKFTVLWCRTCAKSPHEGRVHLTERCKKQTATVCHMSKITRAQIMDLLKSVYLGCSFSLQ